MGRTSKPEQRFEDLLDGRSDQASPEIEALAKLASALAPAEVRGPSDQFRRRLRNELLAQASMTAEDAFAAALDGSPAEAPEEVKPLVAVAAALEPASLPMPSPAFRYALRANLVEQAQGAARPAIVAKLADLNTRMRRSLRVVAATAMATVMLTGSATALVAAQNAVPGDALYGVKRLHESARLMPLSGEAEGRARLTYAAERLEEIEALVERGVTEEALYIGTLNDMDELTSGGTQLLLATYRDTLDEEITTFLSSFLDEQIEHLTTLLDRLPPGVRPAAQDSILVAERAATEVVRTLLACGSCPSDPLFSGPDARVATRADGTCACETPAGSPTDGSSGNNPPGGTGGDGNGGTGGNGGNGGQTGQQPGTDLPDDLPDEIEEPAEGLIDDIIDVIDDPLPLPSPTPTLPSLPPVPSVPAVPSLGL